MANRYDVIVVGAGFGGVVCAALLAKWGLKVLVLDKNERVGGKQMGIETKGFKSELWPTYGIPLEVGPFVDAFKELGIESKLDLIPGSAALMYRRPSGEWATTVNAPDQLDADPTENMFNSWELDAKDREVALQALAFDLLLT
jgi:phytoene dehydrogenase-like protein